MSGPGYSGPPVAKPLPPLKTLREMELEADREAAFGRIADKDVRISELVMRNAQLKGDLYNIMETCRRCLRECT